MINPLVANGHLIVREGLKQPVLRWRNIELVGIADDGNGTPDPMQESSADALLLDTSMQGRGLLDILRRVRGAPLRLRVLVLSDNAELAFAAQVLKAGAFAYLCKYSTTEELADSIDRISACHKYVSPAPGDVLPHLLTTPVDTPDHTQLTDRKYEVLCLSGAGKPNSCIAPELGSSSKTVHTYRTRLLRKTSLTTSAEFIRYAIEPNLISDMQRY